jgi:hypothetical protein
MVERPIKRSERQAKGESEQATAKPASGGFERGGDRPGGRRRDRKGGKDRDRDAAPKPPANPALARGPKPSPKAEVAVEEAVAEAPTEEVADVAEVAASEADDTATSVAEEQA